ncbi:hypothetical protein FI667_g8814, partial [Globisporangium splendens]
MPTGFRRCGLYLPTAAAHVDEVLPQDEVLAAQVDEALTQGVNFTPVAGMDSVDVGYNSVLLFGGRVIEADADGSDSTSRAGGVQCWVAQG